MLLRLLVLLVLLPLPLRRHVCAVCALVVLECVLSALAPNLYSNGRVFALRRGGWVGGGQGRWVAG